MRTDDVLNQIDATLDDWTVSGDAMRSSPAAARPEAPRIGNGPREILIRRLVEHHGLTRMTARHAVLAVEHGRTSGHAALVHAEARAVMDETMQQLREAFRPMAERMAEAFKQLAEAFEHLRANASPNPIPASGRRHDRPAWQSPYGPALRKR